MEGVPYSSSMAPSGSYILIVVSQPATEDHKRVLLERLNKGLLSWDFNSTGCDLKGLEPVCSAISVKNLEDNDVLIQYSTESLGVEVLVSPSVSTLKQCMKNLFSTSTGHKHLIHAGYTFAGSGSWILQNGTFSFDDFLEIFQQADVQSQKHCSIHVHCSPMGPWSGDNFAKDMFASVQFNAESQVDNVVGSEHLLQCLERVLSPQALEEIMATSSLVGNIRFNRPTLYLFPAGQGDCALFGINGFNMLIDGGFNRKPCSWEFIRHLDRLDAVLVTRLCENNVCGMSTLMKRKSINNTYPQIGYVFCNIAENNITSSKSDLFEEKNDLVVSVVQEGHRFTHTLNELKLKPHQCWRDSSVEPFVLYHKVGHGTLEMHILSPPKDSKEMKEFLSQWSSYKESFSSRKASSKGKSLEGAIPLAHTTSICAVLIWRPADPKDTITRILFPGSAPQNKIFESLEKLKALDVLKQPIVTKENLNAVLTKQTSNKVEKTSTRVSLPNRKNTASPALSVSSVTSKNGDVGGIKREVKKVYEVKKDVKVKKEVKKIEQVVKKELTLKKESVTKEVKKETKEIKKTIKKETKDVKMSEKKTEVKSSQKKSDAPLTSTPKAVGEVKKTTTSTPTPKKTSSAKKEVSKVAVQKTTDFKKPIPIKGTSTKESVTKKTTTETKAVPKTKPKTTSGTIKTSAKPPAGSKPGSKMTKAVAESSIVASVVAVTAAAFSLNEKREEIIDDVEPDNISEKELEVAEKVKEVSGNEKSEEVRVSPLPPEALSPTPSESISLTPSDTLSSAPLETVSPTPPLAANEPVSLEEKGVSDIKEIEQDLVHDDAAECEDENRQEAGEIDIEKEIAKLKKPEDVMSMSFMESSPPDDTADDDIEVIKKNVPSDEVHTVQESNNMEDDDKIAENVASKEARDIDDQLAHLSMEGSFCEGVPAYEYQNHGQDQAQLNKYDFDSVATEQLSYDSEKMVEEPENYEKDLHIFEKEERGANEFQDGMLEDKGRVEWEIEKINDKESEILEQSYSGNTKDGNLAEEEKDDEDYEIEKHMHEFEKESAQVGDYEKERICFKSDDDESEKVSPIANQEVRSGEEPEVLPEFEKVVLQDEHQVVSYPDASYQQSTHSTNDNECRMSEQHEMLVVSHASDNRFEDGMNSSDKELSDSEDEKEVIEEKIYQKETSAEVHSSQETAYLQEQVYSNQFSIQPSSESSLYMQSQDYDDTQKIIHDSEMQETSVDEPEEIISAKASERCELGDNYEVEETVQYESTMKNQTISAISRVSDESKLPEDTVEEAMIKKLDDGQIKADSPNSYESFKYSGEKEIAYPAEKNYSYEKDRDSTEDPDDMEGEMIRHPTPPEMKYSEDEMRDPIGPHIITAPFQKPCGIDITEQPLYEEPEDGNSSPIVAQPVFGTVTPADFPELVTVSGGTTPSEPQSPKAFDAKKFSPGNEVMDALSEHDCSESSTHSPLIHEGGLAFEIPNQDQREFDVTDTQGEDENEFVEEVRQCDNRSDGISEDRYLMTAEDHQNEATSDDESHSQVEQSETKSEKSEGPDDEKSDIHRDDKSDNQHDGRSDIMDDDHVESRSDIHDDDNRSDSQYDDRQGDYYDEHGSSNYNMSKDILEKDNSLLEQFESEIVMNQRKEYDHAYDDERQFEDRTAHQQTHDFENIPQEFASEIKDLPNPGVSFSETKNYPTDLKETIPKHSNEKEYSTEYTSNICSSVQCEQTGCLVKNDTVINDVEETFIHTEAIHSSSSVGNREDLTVLAQASNADTDTGNQFSEEYSQIAKQLSDHNGMKTVKDDLEHDFGEKLASELVVDNHHLEELSEQNYGLNPLMKVKDGVSQYDENRSFTEVSEAYQCETLANEKFHAHTSGAEYSGSPPLSNVVDCKSEISSSTVIETSDIDSCTVQEKVSYTNVTTEQEITSGKETHEDYIQSKYSIDKHDFYDKEKFHPHSDFSSELKTTGIKDDYTNSNFETDSDVLYNVGTSHVTESSTVYEQTLNTTNTVYRVSDASKLNDITQTSDSVKGTWSRTQFTTEECTSEKIYSGIPEQEASYIINSRFHSDSPEDNVMRSDSSPDVPPYRVDQKGQITDFGNFPEGDTFKPMSPNMNLSTANKMRNVGHDGPYEESSEDEEDSSSAPVTDSAYAYTNEAYAKEDFDGNRIYQETSESATISAEILKDCEGNDRQNVDGLQQANYNIQAYSETSAANYDFRLEEWGKPMGLPTPPDGGTKTISKKSDKTTAVKSQTNGKVSSPTVASKLSSPLKKPKPKTTKESSSSPVYVDLAYVPHHGEPQYCDVDFFKKVRARYYVFSSINPSKEVLNALLEAKKTWKEDLEVTIIPTYETDTLGYWMAQNQDDLALYSIEVAPSASRCTVNLQDHETSCAAYRLEF